MRCWLIIVFRPRPLEQLLIICATEAQQVLVPVL